MKITTTSRRIEMRGVDPQYAGILLDLPACFRSKHEINMLYAPASPVTAARLRKLCMTNGIRVESYDEGYNALVEEFMEIKCRERFKLHPYGGNKTNWLTQTVPWDHQARALEFCRGLRAAYLAMEMGTGKTLVIIQEILELIAEGGLRFLILCPKSVIDVWAAEFGKHAPHVQIKVERLTQGTAKAKAKEVGFVNRAHWEVGRPAVIVVNYESAWRDHLANKFLKIEWNMVVCDEIHKIKSPSGKASKFCAKLARKARVRRGLSGTPLPNNQLDAFGQWRFLDVGHFGTSMAKFRARYCAMGGYGGYEIVGWQNEGEFRTLVDLLSFRVDKTVLDLPAFTHTRRYAELNKDGARIYKQIERDFVAFVNDDAISMTNVLKRLMKLQQVACGFLIDDDGNTLSLHHEKTKLLREFLESISRSEQVVVFCRFRRDLEEVRELCTQVQRSYGELSGRANDLRQGMLTPEINVLGAQLQAGGIGVNLTAARYCVFYSVGYSLADYLQAEARVHRGGQDRPVTYVHLVTSGTIDEQVYEALAAKKEVADEILAYIKREKV